MDVVFKLTICHGGGIACGYNKQVLEDPRAILFN